jgi:hypothetical protein
LTGLEKITLTLTWFYWTKINNMSNITQDEFDAYVRVQMSGVTNMFNVSVVSDYSGLSRDKIITIMENYNTLAEKYGN